MGATTADMQPAYILHHRAYRDTSALLDVITPLHGRIGVIARGARSGRSSLRGTLRPFLPLFISWGGRGELFTLRQVEVAGRAPALAGQALFAAYYLNELLMRLTQRDDPHPEAFTAYTQALNGFQDTSVEAVLRVFEKRVLDALGYGLVLEVDVGGNPVETGQRYRYIPEYGLEVVSGEGGISGRALLALAGEDCDEPDLLQELKPLMRSALSLYLGGRPLKTRQFLIDMLGNTGEDHGE